MGFSAAQKAIVFSLVATVLLLFYGMGPLHNIGHDMDAAAQHYESAFGLPEAAHSQETVVAFKKEGLNTQAAVITSQQGAANTQAPVIISQQGAVNLGQKIELSKHSTSRSSGARLQLLGKNITYYRRTRMNGNIVKQAMSNKVDSLALCCNQCKTYPNNGCNVCMFCNDKESCGGEYGACWLKHLAYPSTAVAHQGTSIGWVTGTIEFTIPESKILHERVSAMQPSPPAVERTEPMVYHTVTTAQGFATHWETRIHYYWFKKQRAACKQQYGSMCEMGGWTRVLHSGHADDLMDELPTMVVDVLPKTAVRNNWYVVLNRPYALVQWSQRADIPERYVLMAEPDHLFLKPLPNLMVDEAPASFPFQYINPHKKEYTSIVEKFTGPLSDDQLKKIAPIGNSPTFMNIDDMKRVMPIWMNVSIEIFKDKEASKAWGWVQEMYGFCIAMYKADITKVYLHRDLMCQPPWNKNFNWTYGHPFYILHYTYGMDYTLQGEFTPGKVGAWRFDKRTYSNRPIPRRLGKPPDHMNNDLIRWMINAFNEATDAIPCWDSYVQHLEVPKIHECKEKPKHYLAEEAEAMGKGEKGSLMHS